MRQSIFLIQLMISRTYTLCAVFMPFCMLHQKPCWVMSATSTASHLVCSKFHKLNDKITKSRPNHPNFYTQDQFLIPLPFFPLLSPCKSWHPMYIPLNHLKSCYPLVNCHITMERSTMLFMVKSTISMAMFNSFFYVYQRVNPIKTD